MCVRDFHGAPVWLQTNAENKVYAPFRLDSQKTNATWLGSLPHSWTDQNDAKNHGDHDRWLIAKPTHHEECKGMPLTMGYYTREDLPFYYALADAFTVCDAYHCSIFGPTNPNRMFLFTGTNGLAVGNDGPQAIINPPDEVNETADQANDNKAFARNIATSI